MNWLHAPPGGRAWFKHVETGCDNTLKVCEPENTNTEDRKEKKKKFVKLLIKYFLNIRRIITKTLFSFVITNRTCTNCNYFKVRYLK